MKLGGFMHPRTKQVLSEMLFIVVCLAIILLLTACAYVVKNDSANPYSSTNYQSIETTACGLTTIGPNGCYVESDASISNSSIAVQGFYKGEIEFFSDLCNINFVERYNLNERVVFPLSRIYGKNRLEASDSCTFTIIMKPDVVDKSDVKMWPRIGRVFVEVMRPGVQPLKLSRGDQVMTKNSSSGSTTVSLPVNEDGVYQVLGCSNTEVTGKVNNGKAVIQDFPRNRNCKYQVNFKTVTGKKYSWIFFRNVYAVNTDILAKPKITRVGNKVCVEGNQSILSFVSINEKWENSHKMCHTVGSGSAIVRTFTVKRNTFHVVK